MRKWFQDLNDAKRHKFWFRGDYTTDDHMNGVHYELCSGFNLGFAFNCYSWRQIYIHICPFFCSIYLYFWFGSKYRAEHNKKLIDISVHDKQIWWSFNQSSMEYSSKTPRYLRGNFDPIKFLFGKTIYFNHELISHPNVYFSINDNVYKSSIAFRKSSWFRSRLPFDLWNTTRMFVNITLDKPPKHAGKGENSWDQDDDGTYSLDCLYNGPEVSYANISECYIHAIKRYLESYLYDVKNYGVGSSNLYKEPIKFMFLGYKPEINELSREIEL